MLPSGKTTGRIREQNKKRMEYIRERVPNIEVYWECQISKMLSKDKQMKKCFENYNREDVGKICLDKVSCLLIE